MAKVTSNLGAPFAEHASIFKGSTFPANYQSNIHNSYHKDFWLRRIHPEDPSSVKAYLEESLNVSRLNHIEEWLWTAGLPKIARPLHKQLNKARSIIVCEQADCHLVWQDDKILLKPLPGFLLDHKTWEAYLGFNDGKCSRQRELREAATGFLLSYLWLICEESDFHVAQEHKLLPSNVEWKQWSTFAGSVYDSLHDNEGRLKVSVSPRYWYGELRLNRLNLIYRFKVALPRLDLKDAILGYKYTYTTYGNFFERNTAWLVTFVVYVGVVLTAMQVGLATEWFTDNPTFNAVCSVITVISVLAPITVLLLAVVFLILLFFFHAKRAFGERQRFRAKLAWSHRHGDLSIGP